MIASYPDFLLESMLLESRLLLSGRLRELLSKVDSPVTTVLLALSDRDLDLAANHLDMTDSQDQLSFVPDKKVKEAGASDRVVFARGSTLTHNMRENGAIFDLLGYVPPPGDHHTPSFGDVGTVISTGVSPTSGNRFSRVRFEGGECVVRETYLEPDQSEISKFRQQVRTGRLIRSVLAAAGEKFPDKTIEDFVNKYKAAHATRQKLAGGIELVRGNDIAHWYYHENYLHGNNKGTIGNSCMSNVDEDYFDIYVKNPEKCGLLILRDTGNPDKITARALVWKIDEVLENHTWQPTEITMMDRVYYTSDHEVEMLRDWARKSGWHFKADNNSSANSYMVAHDGTRDRLHFRVYIRAHEYENYPYLDTMKFLTTSARVEIDGKRAWTLSNRDSGADYMLESTGGDWLSMTCERCDGNGSITCPECDGDGTVDCRWCNGHGEKNCGMCEGRGHRTCPDCEGAGCDKCKSALDGETTGRVECDSCNGDGSKKCGHCDGDGTEECDDCSGRGYVECPECT